MAQFHPLLGLCVLITMTFSHLGCVTAVAYRAPDVYRLSPWTLAHATFFGHDSAASTMATLTSAIYNNGFACDQCFQIRCVQSPWCSKNIATITATNLCPPNWSQNSNNGGWCNPPRNLFDMAKPAFEQIAQWKAGIVLVMYRR
ncbi:expansin-A7-like [Rutidosis leptorrhynchoides]|uniref:expansin-A7-like n=1 Tax=Rutidosis leptorrhynchoides TaxID=125765 RepID=UPI003A9984BF